MKRQTAEWFSQIFDAIDDFILVKGPNSRLIWANRSFCEHYGMSNADLESLVDGDHTDVDDTLQYVIDDHHVFTSGQPLTVVEPVTKHDGTVSYFETIKVPLRDETGEIVGTVGTSRPSASGPAESAPAEDRADRKTSMDLLRKLVAGMPLPVLVVDRAERVVATSHSVESLFTVAGDEEGLFDRLVALIPELRELASLGDGEPVRRLDSVSVPELGLWLSIEARPWPLPTRGTGGVLVTFHDVTALVEARTRLEQVNAELAERQAELDGILEAVDVGIIVADASGEFRVVNGAARSMLGGQPASWDDQGDGPTIHFEEVPGEHVIREEWPLTAALRGETRSRRPYVLRRSDETQPTWVMTSTVPLPEWSQYSAVLAFHDITRMVHVQQELEEFAFVASHDLREPLRMVTGFVQLLQHTLADKLDADSQSYMDFVIDGSTRMDRMVQDLLTVSREQNRKLKLEPVPLSTMLDEVVDDLLLAATDSGAKIVVGDLPTVMGDRSQLKRLFMNLISNALKFRDPTRTPVIDIQSTSTGSDTVISVADNGIGIATEYREKVFGMFQRLHSRAEFAGTGLGLALCKRIVDRHNGRIQISGNQPNGTIVTVAIPSEENI